MYRKEVTNKLGWLHPRAVNGIHNAQKERQLLVPSHFGSQAQQNILCTSLLAKRLCNYYYIYINSRLVFF